MLIILGTVRLPPDHVDRARGPMRTMVAASRAEEGCLDYAYAQDMLDPGLIHVVERWRDQAALTAHFATEHMAAWRATWRDLAIHDRRLFRYEADEGSAF